MGSEKAKKEAMLERLLAHQRGVKDVHEWRQLEAIWLREKLGLSGRQVAEALNYRLQTVHLIWHHWLRRGEAMLDKRRRPGGRQHAYLKPEQESQFLQQFVDEAGRGGMLDVTRVKEALERHLGRSVALSTVYRMLHRNGWRKIVPRPRHPKADPERQEAVKGGS
jgi:transposase